MILPIHKKYMVRIEVLNSEEMIYVKDNICIWEHIQNTEWLMIGRNETVYIENI